MKPFDVSACLRAIDKSRATEVLDDFVRDAAQRILNDGLQSAIASTDVFDEMLVIHIAHTESVSRHQGTALVRVLMEATGFTGWGMTLGKGVRVTVDRVEFIEHIEAMRGKFLSPPGGDVVRYAGLDWAPGAYGYKAVAGQFILLVRPDMEWVVYDRAMVAGTGVARTLTEAADAAVVVFRREGGF